MGRYELILRLYGAISYYIMVQDHFQTPPDPQKGCKGLNVTLESLENIFRLRACLTFANTCWRECISDTWTLSNALLKK